MDDRESPDSSYTAGMSPSDRDAPCFSVALTALISKLWMETLCNGIYPATLTEPQLLRKIHSEDFCSTLSQA